MYRMANGVLEVLLVHPGGPIWARKDQGAWFVPKGEIEPGEGELAAAEREFEEETGVRPAGPYVPLGSVKHKSGKLVIAWAFAGTCNPAEVTSNTWPDGVATAIRESGTRSIPKSTGRSSSPLHRRERGCTRRSSRCWSGWRRYSSAATGMGAANAEGVLMNELLADVARRAAAYLETVPGRGVSPAAESVSRLAQLGGPVPEGPSDAEEVIRLLDEIGSPATVTSTGGRYFGFVIGGALPTAHWPRTGSLGRGIKTRHSL